MKKFLIINSNTEILPYPVAPLGVALVASSLKRHYHVKVFDAAFNTTAQLVELIKDFAPDYIGVGLRNIDNVTMRGCQWYLGKIKESIINPVKKNFNGPLILGGSGFSIAPKQVLEFYDADYGIIGEAENKLPELLSYLEKGETNFLINNVITKKQVSYNTEKINSKKLVIPRANIDTFINYYSYNTRGSYPIQTKRGCSHQCIYCSYPNIEGKKYRLREVVDIVDEIEEVSQRIHQVTFEFVDSVFNTPLDYAINICKEIIRRDLNVKLRTMGINPGDVTDELISVMKNAGFSQIDCTPDSASEIMIKSYRKNFTKNKLIQCADIIRKHNMPTMWFFMVGGPGETKETILETFDFIDRYISPEDMVHITEGIRIIPNTQLYDIALEEGVISENDSVIQPMFYVSPSIGKENLTLLLEQEIAKRENVLNSIDTSPPPERLKQALDYRQQYLIDEPMFRTLLRLKKWNKKTE
ncbi:MAG: B12-binding domain-containing radical SAM protein [Bacteroidota bacterium]